MKGFLSLLTVLLSVNLLFAQPLISLESNEFQADNQLRYDINFSTSEEAFAYARFFYLDGTDTISTFTSIEGPATDHTLTLSGLLASTAYQFRIFAFNSEGPSSTEFISFNTSALSTDLPIADSLSIEESANLNGYILTNTDRSEAGLDGLGLVWDRDGNLLWYQDLPGNEEESLCQSVQLTEERTILMTDCKRIMEIGLDGKIINLVDLGSDSPWINHHQALKDEEGNYIVLAILPDTTDLSSVGGAENALILGNGFYVINSIGVIEFEWSVFDHYDVLESTSDNSYWSALLGDTAINWRHATSIHQDLDNNYLLSFPDLNQIIKISRSTGNILWRFGDDGDIDILPDDRFKLQSGINGSSGFTYMMIDHQTPDKPTRALEYFIDFGYTTPMMMINWQHAFPLNLSGEREGSAIRLENGNNLLSSGSSGNIREVSPDQEVLWHLRQDEGLRRAWFLDAFYPPAPETHFMTNMLSLCEGDLFSLNKLVQPDGGYFTGENLEGGNFTASLDPGMSMQSYLIVYQYGYDADTLIIQVDNCTGIDPNSGLAADSDILLFPNPTEENTTLQFNLVKQANCAVYLTDLQGRDYGQVFSGSLSQGTHQINIDLERLQLSPLLYTLLIDLNGIRFSRSLVYNKK